jgi:hypothetical protein
MADALVDFLSCRPDWLPEDSVWDAITWRDDPYSEDFTNRVSDALLQRNLGQVRKSVVPYSVGEAWLPNVRERQIIEEDLAERIAQTPASPRVLVLPTVERTARRVLIGLGQAAPLTAGQITVVVGDSISFNVVCRDRRLLWPTELLPMRVLLFAHEDPAHLMGTTSPRLAELASQTASAIGKVCGQWPVSIPAFSQLCSRHAATDESAFVGADSASGNPGRLDDAKQPASACCSRTGIAPGGCGNVPDAAAEFPKRAGRTFLRGRRQPSFGFR